MRGPDELLDRVEYLLDEMADRIEELLDIESDNSKQIVESKVRQAIIKSVVAINREQSLIDFDSDEDDTNSI